jgi:HK97 family phage major capsid protein
MNANELRLKSDEIANQARALLNTITDENRGEKEAEFDRMMDDADAFAARADRMAGAEARSREWSAITTEIPSQTVEVEARSGGLSEEDVRAGIFNEYLRGVVSSAEVRAAGVATNAAGGFTVPTDLSSTLIETMKAYGPLNVGGPVNYLMTESGNPLNFATNNDTANKATLIAENTQAGDKDVTFGQISLGAYKLTSGVFKVSSELIADSAINITQFVGKAIGERFGRGINELLTSGTGTSQPQGLVTGASVGKTAAATNGILYDELIDLYHSIDPAYRGNFAFMFHDDILKVLRKLKDGEGRYVWTPANGPIAKTIVGQRYYINNDMESTLATGKRTVLGGDFSKYTARMAGGLSIKRLDERYADSDQVGFVGFARIDGKVMDPSAIKVLVQA